MRLRWYICSLVMSFAIFGIVQNFSTQEPNQEVVLQFSDIQSDVNTIQAYISIIEDKLQEFDAEAITIIAIDDDLFKIVYRSDKAVETIENALKAIGDFESSSNPNTVQLDVFELKAPSQNNWDFEGQLVYSSNPKSDRFSEVKPTKFSTLFRSTTIDNYFTKVNQNVIDFTFASKPYHLLWPETRAGPGC